MSSETRDDRPEVRLVVYGKPGAGKSSVAQLVGHALRMAGVRVETHAQLGPERSVVGCAKSLRNRRVVVTVEERPE